MSRPKSKIDSLKQEERKDIAKRLHSTQKGLCYVCKKPILLDTTPNDIDHITSLDSGGIDDINNWGLTHEACNRSKGTRDLQLQRYLFLLEEHIEKYTGSDGQLKEFTVNEALNEFFPERKEVPIKADMNKIILYFDIENKQIVEEYPIILDPNDPNCKSFIGLIPFKYIFHDKTINPRSIVDLSPLIEEFYNKNPQLLPCLAHIEFTESEGKAKILLFDGQHKAAAQMYIGNKELLTRVFINYDKNKMGKVNYRAHTKLAQIHFPQMINDKVGHDIFDEEFSKFISSVDVKQKSESYFFDHVIDYSQKSEYRGYFKNFLKYMVLGEDNKIISYVETITARSKKVPLSYDTVQKGFLNNFLFLRADSDSGLEETQKFRQLERENLIKLMNMFSENLLENKFDKKLGIFRIEEKLKDDPDKIPDKHLLAYRICRQAPLIIWTQELKLAISSLLDARSKYKDAAWRGERVLWANIDREEWERIRKMINVISQHKVWTEKINKDVISAISSTKQSDWKDILLHGRLPGTTESKYSSLDKNFIFDNSA